MVDYLTNCFDRHEYETGHGGESYSQDRILDQVERDVRILKRSDGRYSVSAFDPIKDDSLAYYPAG